MIKPETFQKPWRSEVQYVLNSPVTVKILRIKRGESTSLQRHKRRAEFWRVLNGKGILEVGTDKINIKPNLEVNFDREIIHRITATEEDVEILEISTGYFDPNDIERLEDKYGRKT
jgi:mannose-6-phosphate isomerase-like protein (cupin superfamily)